MSAPDVTGMKFRDAEKLLISAGTGFTVDYIKPLKTYSDDQGEYRVVRQSSEGGIAHLVLCSVSTASRGKQF